ncbi:cysteine-rich small domain-containing protein [Solidesulfovibrio sp.]
MPNSHRFFRNDQCRYFPCHAGADPATFNCLFCFCPLYFLKDCGGDSETRHGVKDCTPCLRPHRPEGYDQILARLREEARRQRENQPPGDG